MARTFEAKYPGRCANGDRIAVGDEVTYSDDELVHVSCDDAVPTVEPARGEVCMTCFMEKPLSGGCPNCD